MKIEKVAVASDHAGYEQKQKILSYLKNNSISYNDLGTYSAEPSDYPDYGHALANAVASGDYDFGISLCGSGNGINMTANKHHDIRSALCWNPEIAALAKKHNNANIIAIPARFVSEEEAVNIVEAYISSSFEGGRHIGRINKIPCKKQ